MSEEIVPKKTYRVKITANEFTQRRIELMKVLHEFLTKDVYHYCLVAIPGFGKSTTILEFLLKNHHKFLYVANSKETADQLALKCEAMGFSKPLVIHNDSTDTFDSIPDQCITIYDHFSRFVDKHNPALMRDKICIIDEAANLIQQRDLKFRYNVIRKLELKLKYFKKIVYMTATPIDYAAYGDDLEVIKLEDDSEPTNLIAVPYGTYTEMKDIAEVAKYEIEKGRQTVIYLQSLGAQLSELKQYLKQLGIKSISYYNSQQKENHSYWETETLVTEEKIKETGLVTGQCLITTYSDGISILNDGFSFISCSKADYHTVYQAMNRFRKGCHSYYVMSNAYQNGEDHLTVYEKCKQEVYKEVDRIIEALEHEDSLEERQFYLTEKRTTLVNIEGIVSKAEVIRQAVIKQHQNFATNYHGLKTAFAQYNIKLKHWPRIPNRSELEYTAESKEKVLNGIFASLEAEAHIPNIHPEREYLDKINELLKYLDYHAVKQFMLTEFVKRTSSYDEKLQQLQLDYNAKDALLKLRLLKALESGKRYLSTELDAIICLTCLDINYQLVRSTVSTLEGLGIKCKYKPVYKGMTEEWSDKQQKMVKKQVNESAYVITY